MITLEVTPKQVKAISLLVTGMTGREVAKKVGVSYQTVSEWNNDPVFSVYVNQLKQEALDEARDKLRGLALEAVNSLQDLMINAKNEEVRRKASLNILEMTGLLNPNSGLYGFGIGPTSLSKYKSDEDYKRQIEKLTSNLTY